MRSFLRAIIGLLSTVGLIFGANTLPALAAGPAITLVEANSTLAGSTLSGFDPNTTLRLALIASSGNLTFFPQGSGVSLLSNQERAQGLWFEGTPSQLEAALGEVIIEKPCGGNYKIYAQVSDSGYLKDPISGHYYKYINNYLDYDSALAAAAATPLVNGANNTFGYLATITSPVENILVANMFGPAWLGATDVDTEGDWKWVTGPEAGTSFYSGNANSGGATLPNHYASWANGEPNNWGPGENHSEILSDGNWNDIEGGSRAYTIEWGGMPGDDLTSVSVVSSDLTISVIGGPSGTGTEADPYLINSANSLYMVASCGGDNAYYKQTANITLPGDWGGAQNFRGHYDGDGHTISYPANFVFNHDTAGIWGYVFGGEIKNLTVVGDIDTGGNGSVGLLYGRGGTSVTDVTVDGSINSSGQVSYIGGIAGQSWGNMNRVTSTVDISSSVGSSSVGGLAGYFESTISNSSWSGSINLTATNGAEIWNVGGLAGETDCSTITMSHATGTITANGPAHNIGGLAGYYCGDLTKSYADVDVTAVDGENVGGLAGYGDGYTYSVYAEGTVSGNQHVGGLIGSFNWATLDDSYAIGNVTAVNQGGSLVGYSSGATVRRAYTKGTVAAGETRGAFGYLENQNLEAVLWDANVAGPADTSVLGNGEVLVSTSDLQDINVFSNNGYNILDQFDSGYNWGICAGFNSGNPYLTALYDQDPCLLAQTLTPTPTISGTGVEGSVLTAVPGTWDSGVTLTYKWNLDGNVISGATASTYTPVAGDVGKTVTVTVRSEKSGYRAVEKTSAGKVITAKPVITPSNSKNVLSIGGFAGNTWWAPLGFESKIKSAVKAHPKASQVTCVGIVAPGGWPAWQKTLGLKRAALACGVVNSANSKIKVKLTWKVAKSSDAVLRGVQVIFNK